MSSPPRRFAAIVLAAGASTRMGRANKLLEEVEGMPIVRRAVDALATLSFRERIIVTGTDADRVCEALHGTDVRCVHNAQAADGIASSIRTGVRALPPGLDGVLIVPGDMPWLAAADVAALVGAFDPDRGCTVCVPVRAGRRGNPVLWAARHFEALAALEGDTGGRQLFDLLAGELCEVAVQGEGVLVDVDTPEALDAARRRERA